ncbi:MAG: phospholipid carrier-dependent glycosyltransferase [Bauldia sp.]|nr:phospholipid carrier-dependent glycosyltransferase [Bauldia sp.]
MAGSNAVTASFSTASDPAAGGSGTALPAASSRPLLRLLPAVLAAIYFAVMMPIGADMILHYPDERHYAYGGARMVETGDWLIPRTPQGEIRLKKPVIPYWFSAAGFELLGIGVPGFRLFWVIAASGILLLTYGIARGLGAPLGAALLAEIMIAANPVFLRAAINAIPDIPLTFFVTLAAFGFVRILAARQESPARGWAWVAWLGMACAVLAKGMLPIVLVASLLAYLVALDRRKLSAVLRPLPILAAGALVAAWYVYAAVSYPEAFAAQFFGDQITGNAAKGAWWVLVALPGYLLAGIFSFLAWPLLLIGLGLEKRPPPSPLAWPSPARLLAVWCAVVVVVFAFSDAIDPRYLLPVMPAFSALLAAGIGALDGPGLPRVSAACRWLLLPAVALGLILAVPEVLVLLQVGGGLAIALVGFGVAMWVAFAATGWRAPQLAPHLLGATPVLAFGLGALAMAPVVLPDRGVPFAAALEASDAAADRAAFVGDVHTASETRLAAGTADPFVEVENITDALAGGYCVVMATQRGVARKLEDQGYTVSEVRGGWRDIDLARFLGAVFSWRLAEARAANGSIGYVAACSGQRTVE